MSAVKRFWRKHFGFGPLFALDVLLMVRDTLNEEVRKNAA